MTIVNPNLQLSNSISKLVNDWSQSNYPKVNGKEITDVTRSLLNFWFKEGNSMFYDCQKEAMETLIYYFEILRNPSLPRIYEYMNINSELILKEQIQKYGNFPKLCLKMATGTGKTWIIIMTIIWQYLNAIILNNENYSKHFLIVAPGLVVYDRLLNSFFGNIDKNGKRDSNSADFNQDFFYPSIWRDSIKSIRKISKEDIHSSMEVSDNPFILITNWHRLHFTAKKKTLTLWDAIYQADINEDESATEILKSLLLNTSDLTVLNDEAHHTHDIKDTTEKVWQESIN